MKKLFTAILSAILFFGLNTANAQNSTTNQGGMIQFQTYGGPDANAFYIPADRATDRVLIVFHEWYGLTDNIKKEAQNWQKLFDGNVAVYAIDLYDGKVTTEKFAAGKMMNNLDPRRAEAIINGLLQKIGPGKQIATLGWGMGGTWAFTASAIAGSNAAGCVMYYSYPVKDDNRFKQLKTDVLYLLANQDEYISRADMEEFGKKVTAAGRGFTYESFNGNNGFANIGDPDFSNRKTRETQYLTLKFFKHKLSL
ncbi:MAG: dienelactone hydrolase family protein [Chitinophagales bacterium]